MANDEKLSAVRTDHDNNAATDATAVSWTDRMPIVEPAPWRHQYFADVACPDDVMIPADDPEAWAWNPAHRWAFDKLQVALTQGFDAAPHGLAPTHYPVFSKPIFNFGGMGVGSRVLASTADYEAHNTPGHMWMPLLEGRHVSTDLAIVDGRVVWLRHATGKATRDGMFDYWTVHRDPMPALACTLLRWAESNLAGYTGMLNVETIGPGIIEAHLRFADQWPDLYGPGWVEALVGLYARRDWRFADRDRRDGFSIALFGPHGQRFSHPPRSVVDEVLALRGVSSVQITFHADKAPEAHSMPPGGFRVALVNAVDLDAGRRGRERLARWFGI